MSRTEIEALVLRWCEAVAVGGELAWDDLLTEDIRDLSGGVPVLGRDSFKARAAAVRSAFAEVRVSVEHLVVAVDSIAWRWSLTGVHVGTFLGIGATGKRISLAGVNFQRLRDRRVAEHWTLADLTSLARQLREGSSDR
jgi:steroid delta-isomerase-like uncharacterized protein